MQPDGDEGGLGGPGLGGLGGPGLGGLEEMMGQMDMGAEDEDQFMKMMQGMMSTLLSKEVLYPSLVELRKQVGIEIKKVGNYIRAIK